MWQTIHKSFINNCFFFLGPQAQCCCFSLKGKNEVHDFFPGMQIKIEGVELLIGKWKIKMEIGLLVVNSKG